MAKAVFLLCATTSIVCAVLLLRAYRATASRLLLWSALCFIGLALNNGLLVVDRLLLPDTVDLSLWRQVPALIGIGLLLYGLVWDAE